jgi:DNA-directed RNA polymerase subunit RPC12/RpoP
LKSHSEKSVTELETRLFRCTDCDREFRLQAWKAVCPSCGRQYTLVPVEEEVKGPSPVYAYVSALAILASAIYLLLSGAQHAVLALVPSLVAVPLVLTRSRVGHLVAVVVSAVLAVMLGLPLAVFPLAAAALALYDEYRITRYKLVRQRLRSSGMKYVEA